MFAQETLVESKQLCYEMIEQPMGPEKCFELPMVTNDQIYLYNYFYKYLCLMFEYVELDEEAVLCLDAENIDDRLIYGRDSCLKAYESELMPELTTDGPLYIY